MSVTVVHYLRAVLVCSIAGLFCSYQFMLQGAPSAMVPQLTSALDLSLANVGVLSSSFLYTYLLFQIPGGYLADRYRAPYLLVACSLLMALACYWFSGAGSMLEACMARALMGVATSPVVVVCLNLVSRWFPERWFCALAGLVEGFALLGGAAGPIVFPLLMEDYGWRGAMALAALPGCILAVCSFIWVRDYPENAVIEKKDHAQKSCTGEHNEQPLDGWLYGLYCLFCFGLFSMIGCFASLWGVPYLNVRYPEQTELVAFSISLIFVGTAIGGPLLGIICTRIPVQFVMLLSLLAGMVTTGLLVLCHCPLSLIALLCFIAGFATGGYTLVFGAVRIIAPKQKRGILLAGANGSMLLVGPVLQPMMGWLLDYRISLSDGLATLLDYQFGLLPLFIVQMLALMAIVMIVRR